MHHLHQLLFTSHIATGLVAIIAFWVPVATRKGSTWHVRAGRFYAFSMYGVVASAFLMCVMVLLDPIGIRAPARNLDADTAYAVAAQSRLFASFLLMLSLLVFSSLRHGLLALRVSRDPLSLSGRGHRALLLGMGLVSLLVGWQGIEAGQILLIVFAVLGATGAVNMYRETLKTDWNRRSAIVAHLNGLIGTGIGAYTAVFAFGGSRLLDQLLPGQWQVVPWVLPAIIGTLAIRRQRRKYLAPRPTGRAPGSTQAGPTQPSPQGAGA